jgi:predicted esterase YcpF (UPF0227 family)
MTMPTTPPTTHILYLHGFRSSPQSAKARQMAALVAGRCPNVTWWCPQLPASPREAMKMLMDVIQTWPRDTMSVIGSSLGGFYATAVAEETGCKAVLLNPAVNPARDLEKYIGEQTSWHDPQERFFFLPEFVDELRAITQGMAPPKANSLTQLERTFAVIAKGDEVLDWQEMTGRYKGARIKLLEGGDHALNDFDDHVGDILAFLNLR